MGCEHFWKYFLAVVSLPPSPTSLPPSFLPSLLPFFFLFFHSFFLFRLFFFFFCTPALGQAYPHNPCHQGQLYLMCCPRVIQGHSLKAAAGQPQAAAQTRVVRMAFGGKRDHKHLHRPLLLQGLHPRHDPQWQHWLGYHYGLRWQCWLLASGSSSSRSVFRAASLRSVALFYFSFSLSHICSS